MPDPAAWKRERLLSLRVIYALACQARVGCSGKKGHAAAQSGCIRSLCCLQAIAANSNMGFFGALPAADTAKEQGANKRKGMDLGLRPALNCESHYVSSNFVLLFPLHSSSGIQAHQQSPTEEYSQSSSLSAMIAWQGSLRMEDRALPQCCSMSSVKLMHSHNAQIAADCTGSATAGQTSIKHS